MENRETGSFRDLDVWRLAMDLAVEVYSLTRSFPSSETFGLASQMQRAAVSIAANIAEGNSRDHLRDHIRFVVIARGSLNELDTQLEIATRLGYGATPQHEGLKRMILRVGMMLTKLRQNLQRRSVRR